MLEGHGYTAQQILQQIKTQGYSGGYSTLEELVRLLRPARKPAYLTLEFAPGQCAQVDWGSFGWANVGATRRRLSFFVMALCYTRLLYGAFTLCQAMERFLSCHQHAFDTFCGMPGKIMID